MNISKPNGKRGRKSSSPGMLSRCADLTPYLLAVIFVVAMAGCGGDAGKQIELHPVDIEGYRQVLSEHRGDVIVVDFWATWCPPCVESFPKFVELHSRYADEGVVVIGVSVDFPGTEEDVLNFLEEHEARFKNLIVDADDIDAFISSVSGGWAGDIPAVFVYDRSGELAGEFFGSGAVDGAESVLRDLLSD